MIILSKQLAAHYQYACLSEVEALKPGNVHIFADGHGMKVSDFVQSAEASAAVIALTKHGLGRRIYYAIEQTLLRVNCNTNLGIVLLCAPIIQTALWHGKVQFQDSLISVIREADQSETVWLFEAIKLANPAGLGVSSQYDVNEAPNCTIYEAMAASASRDFIGLQYQNGFNHLFHEGLPVFAEAMRQWDNPIWATTAVYLYWLSHYPDSHIARKYDESLAINVQQEASSYYETFMRQSNPKLGMASLLGFDQSLKVRNINPGTSADLTVATILLNRVLTYAN